MMLMGQVIPIVECPISQLRQWRHLSRSMTDDFGDINMILVGGHRKVTNECSI
jgi:hypothetical protein